MGELGNEPSRTNSSELSIAFSAEELSALTTLLHLPPVAGAAVGEMSAETSAAARRSLRARGVLGTLDDSAATDTVASAVADLLLIASAPQAAIEISVSNATGSEISTRRYALTPPAGIDHTEDDGVHRFTPFAAVDVLARLAACAGLAGQTAAPDGRLPAAGLTVPEDMLRLATGAPAIDRVAATLVAAGLTAADAALLAAVIQDRQRVVTVRARRPVRPGAVEGMDASWAVTSVGLIDWPLAPGGAPKAADPWHRPDEPVTIRPLDIRALLAELATAITGGTVDGQ